MVRSCGEKDVSMRAAVMTGGNVRLGKYMTAYPVSCGKREPWAIKDASGHYIAYLEWYAPWRQYVMNAESTAVFSHDCLTAIAGFCQKLTRQSDLTAVNPSGTV